ncbi:methyl-accepting chemotaxis protein [Arenibaculum sp.]|jgi:methyl-accepting chemotaxis protein|uniref:methyl-accepting chemotaxis protein n=1 Tax=Arenibaculum sp. TaxID=2865862 RepID=UPI002E1173C1|nr:methyl-accepting chemotaxis protein [Arenibaculum sp.]
MMKNFSLSAKMQAVICLLSVSCIVIAVIAASSIQALSTATSEVGTVVRSVRTGGELSRSFLDLTLEYSRIGLDPDEFDEIKKQIEARNAVARERIEAVVAEAGHAHAEEAEMVSAIAAAFGTYEADLKQSLQDAQTYREEGQLRQAQYAMLAAIASSRSTAEAVVKAILAFEEHVSQEGFAIVDDASSLAAGRETLIVVAAAASILLGGLLGWLITRFGVVKPIRSITACLRRLADGDLETEVVGTARKDEIGEIAQAAQTFKDNLIKARGIEQEAKEMEARAQADRRRAILDLAERFEHRVGSVVKEVSRSADNLKVTAANLSSTVERVNALSAAVVAASEQANASVGTVAAASEEMSSAIHELSHRLTQSASRSRKASEGMDEAQREFSVLLQTIEQVDQIVAAINTVAEQTNLLALNATIEAARAGEAGKGFAVVASEVKNLASQTRGMTEQIGGQIGSVKAASNRTVQSMSSIVQQIGDIDQSSADMAVSVEQQSAATTEISRSAQQAAAGTSAVSASIADIREAGNATGAASSSVELASNDLARQAGALHQAVEDFLSEVRAA